MFSVLLYPFIFGISYFVFKIVEKRDSSPLDELKNALLIYALDTICPEDFENEDNKPYEKFDGSTLPSLNGCYGGSSKYFNYILEDRAGFVNMKERSKAIESYLETRFESKMETESFFNLFREVVDSALFGKNGYEDEVESENSFCNKTIENPISPLDEGNEKDIEHHPVVHEDDYDHVNLDTKKEV
jgi:hypothetical protein